MSWTSSTLGSIGIGGDNSGLPTLQQIITAPIAQPLIGMGNALGMPFISGMGTSIEGQTSHQDPTTPTNTSWAGLTQAQKNAQETPFQLALDAAVHSGTPAAVDTSSNMANTTALQAQLASESNARLGMAYYGAQEGLTDQPSTVSKILLGA